MWPGQWSWHQVNVFLDHIPSWTWKGAIWGPTIISKLRKNISRWMSASTMRVWAPRRHLGMAPWSLGGLCWMLTSSVRFQNCKLSCKLTFEMTSALCLCTQLSVESMVSNKIDDGQIIMIGSMSGHRVPPNPSTRQRTNASKHHHH